MRIVSDDKRVTVFAPAKLNLFLEVLARRDDGYHNIETVMTAIDVCDTLSLARRADDDEIVITSQWSIADPVARKQMGDVPVGPKNIVVRALEQLRKYTNVRLGATVHLQKRIASAAGLGGASSDAAAALVAANDLWQTNLDLDQLAAIASDIGSDIPFFFGPPVAICRGRGEIIEPLFALPSLDVVVVKPPVGLSTPAVYKLCNPASAPKSSLPLINAWRGGDIASLGRLLTNRLQPAAEQLSPWIERLREAFSALGCYGHQMSGSGSSYFGICKSAAHARQVGNRLRAGGLGFVYVTRTIGVSRYRQGTRAAS